VVMAVQALSSCLFQQLVTQARQLAHQLSQQLEQEQF
jgi:hypothetical protein